MSDRRRFRSRLLAGGKPAARREDGFSFVELLVAVTLVGTLAAMAVSQFILAYDRARQRGSMADLRSMAAAQGAYRVDKGSYAPNLTDIQPYYLGVVPPNDRWGNAWVHSSTGASYTTMSLGKDAAAGPAPPVPWHDEPMECDLIVTNGAFTQAPTQKS